MTDFQYSQDDFLQLLYGENVYKTICEWNVEHLNGWGSNEYNHLLCAGKSWFMKYGCYPETFSIISCLSECTSSKYNSDDMKIKW